MFSRDRWQEIFDTIKKNKLRTVLSGFTVALGILIFTVLFGMGNGLRNGFMEMIGNDATNTMTIFGSRTNKPYRGFKQGRQVQLRNDDLEDLAYDFRFFLEYLTPKINRRFIARYQGESNTYSTVGVGPDNRINEETIMMKGRYLNQKDVEDQAKVVVIGRLIEQDLFGKNKNSLGEFLEVNGVAYRVIGVFQDEGGDNEERVINMPYTTLQLVEKGNDEISQIVVGYRRNLGFAQVMELERLLLEYLKDKHNVAPSDQGGIFIRNIAERLQQNLAFLAILQLVVLLVGIGTLIAGVIGISNIMVFVVKERTKELGIRKALGASPWSVTGMILQESVFITAIAGYGGLILGVAVLKLMGDKLDEYFIINPSVGMGTMAGATVILIFSGALAGYIPARRAARIKPIVALRDE